MTLSGENKAELLRFLDSALFQGCCVLVAQKAASQVDLGRPAADLGVLLALEKGINQFPALLRELVTENEPPSPLGPRKTLRPDTRTLRP